MSRVEVGARKCPHLTALLSSWVLAAVAAGVVWVFALHLERRAAAGELSVPGEQTTRGLAMQRAVLERDDVHLLFGSSEIVRPSAFRAMEFFRSEPLGFRVVGVGKRGTPLAVTAHNLAALSASLRDRKIAISISHTFFHADRDTSEAELQTYLGTFSVRHASEIAFAGALTADVRRRIARRLLSRPQALDDEPLIHAALRWRADTSLLGLVAYSALAPMGKVQRLALTLQDHLRLSRELASARSVPVVESRREIDWTALSDSAERLYLPRTSNNPFGILNSWWNSFGDYLLAQRGARNDGEWRRDVESADAWDDLELILDILNSAGARPLLLNLPHKGAYRDFEGTTAAGRRSYYDSLRVVARRAGVPLRDFAEFEYDLWFMRDQSAHPSPKGWVHYDHEMAEFFRQAAQ